MTIFKSENLRTLPTDGVPNLRLDQSITLILVTASGNVSFSNGRAGKDEIIARVDFTADLLMLAWTGSYRTDIFRLTVADIEQHYRRVP